MSKSGNVDTKGRFSQRPVIEKKRNHGVISCMNLILIWFAALVAVTYTWSLPWLATIGFSEKGATSISGFISNAHATGGMAVVSAIPLYTIVQYQSSIGSEVPYVTWLWITQRLFLLCYGAFLVCTVTWVPLIHSLVVGTFCVAFILHSFLVLKCVEPCLLGKIVLMFGCLAFISLLFVNGLWFWAMECVGFGAMVTFTPIEYLVRRRRSTQIQSIETNLSATLVSKEMTPK
jgi:hypothetical protein